LNWGIRFLVISTLALIGTLLIISSILKPKKESNNIPQIELNSENLITQYKENQENQRTILKTLWEIPTVAIAISSAFLIAAYNFFPDKISYPINPLIRAILLSFGFLLMFTVFLAVIKHRYFRGVWLEYSEMLEAQLGLFKIPMNTDDAKKTKTYKNTFSFHKLFLDLRAERWLANVLLLISSVFLLLSILNLSQYLRLL